MTVTKAAAKGVCALAGLAVALGFGELSARFIGGRAHPEGVRHWSFDPRLNHRLKPGMRVEIPCEALEGAWRSIPFELRIDDQGWRDYGPHRLPDRDGRILFVGDSFVQNNCIADEQTLAYRATKLLNARLGTAYGFVNAGVESYATCEEAAITAELIPRILPRAVVLVVYVGNDLQDNVSGPLPSEGWLPALRRGSHLYGLTRAAILDHWRSRGSAPTSYRTEQLTQAYRELGLEVPRATAEAAVASWLERAPIYDPLDEARERRRIALRSCLDYFRQSVGKSRPGLVVLVPAREQASAWHWRVYVNVLAANGFAGTLDPSLPIAEATTVLEQARTPWIDTTGVLAAMSGTKNPYFRLDGHLSPAGIEAVAADVASHLGEVLGMRSQ